MKNRNRKIKKKIVDKKKNNKKNERNKRQECTQERSSIVKDTSTANQPLGIFLFFFSVFLLFVFFAVVYSKYLPNGNTNFLLKCIGEY